MSKICRIYVIILLTGMAIQTLAVLIIAKLTNDLTTTLNDTAAIGLFEITIAMAVMTRLSRQIRQKPPQ